MHVVGIHDVPEEILLNIFQAFELQTCRKVEHVCIEWNAVMRKLWRQTYCAKFYTLFKNHELPIGRQLNKALHWLLKRCGSNLTYLDLSDPSPEHGLIRVNIRTFKIIGHYCRKLEHVNFANLVLVNDSLLDFVAWVDCSRLKSVNLRRSFSHYCAVHNGLSALYEACTGIKYLDISHSINAQIKDCRELWPPTLEEVFVDEALAITGYTLLSLTKCCPHLETFSMCGSTFGMNSGLQFVFHYLTSLRKLYVRDYPGTIELGLGIMNLSFLEELHLGSSSFACDEVLCAIAQACRKLKVLECNMSERSDSEKAYRYGCLTDKALFTIARLLPELTNIGLNYRQHITDDGILGLTEIGCMESVSLAGCENITQASLELLARKCIHLDYLDITAMQNLSTFAVERIMMAWFVYSTCYWLDILTYDTCIDIDDLIHAMKHDVISDGQRFILNGSRPRKTITVHADLMKSMWITTT